MTNDEQQLLQSLRDATRAVFFGGAGVSTESGIPDFRSSSGIYQAQQHYGARPETILSHSFFLAHPAIFYRFYKDMMLYPSALPNPAHHALASLEQSGHVHAVVTQNIDNLHARAGSQRVWELHGSVERNYCMKCGAFYDLAILLSLGEVPYCPQCGGLIKPDVVLYEEPLSPSILDGAIEDLSKADLLIVGGTSLNVYPAAGLLRAYTGKQLILMNQEPTAWDRQATLLIRTPIGQTFQRVMEQFEIEKSGD